MAGRPLTDLFPVTDDTVLDARFLGRLMSELEARIASLQILKQGLEAAIGQAQDVAVERLGEIIGPAQADLDARLEAADARLAELQAAEFRGGFYSAGAAPHGAPVEGDRWFDTEGGREFMFFQGFWVQSR